MADIDIIDNQMAELESTQEAVIDKKSELHTIKRRASRVDEYDSDTTTLVIDHIDGHQVQVDGESEGIRVEVTTTELTHRIKRLLNAADWSTESIASSIESDGDDEKMFVHTISLVYLI